MLKWFNESTHQRSGRRLDLAEECEVQRSPYALRLSLMVILNMLLSSCYEVTDVPFMNDLGGVTMSAPDQGGETRVEDQMMRDQEDQRLEQQLDAMTFTDSDVSLDQSIENTDAEVIEADAEVIEADAEVIPVVDMDVLPEIDAEMIISRFSSMI